jgi:hypothetical protein
LFYTIFRSELQSPCVGQAQAAAVGNDYEHGGTAQRQIDRPQMARLIGRVDENGARQQYAIEGGAIAEHARVRPDAPADPEDVERKGTEGGRAEE